MLIYYQHRVDIKSRVHVVVFQFLGNAKKQVPYTLMAGIYRVYRKVVYLFYGAYNIAHIILLFFHKQLLLKEIYSLSFLFYKLVNKCYNVCRRGGNG